MSKKDFMDLQGLEGFTKEEILMDIKNHIDEVLYYETEGAVLVKRIGLIGSRVSYSADSESDLDVVVEYEGYMREDDLFNGLNEEHLFINGVEVDFSPYSVDQGNSLEFQPFYESMLTLFDKNEYKHKKVKEKQWFSQIERE